MARGNNQISANGSALDFEVLLRATADKLRGYLDASEYQHVWLGRIFLKCLSAAFGEKRGQLLSGFSDSQGGWFITISQPAGTLN